MTQRLLFLVPAFWFFVPALASTDPARAPWRGLTVWSHSLTYGDVLHEGGPLIHPEFRTHLLSSHNLRDRQYWNFHFLGPNKVILSHHGETKIVRIEVDLGLLTQGFFVINNQIFELKSEPLLATLQRLRAFSEIPTD